MDLAGNSDPTLASLLAHYLRIRILTGATVARYDLVVRNLTRFIGGATAAPSDIALNRVTPDVMLDFRAWSLKRMRPVSFNTERRHLSVLFNAAVQEGWMLSNPLRKVQGAPVTQLLPKALPRDSMQAYMEWLRTSKALNKRGMEVDLIQPQWFWLIVLRTLYYTGMRKRQLLGMVWEDIDFVDKTIKMAATSSKTRREWLVPLPDQLLPDLLTLRSRTQELYKGQMDRKQVFCLPLFSERRTTFRHATMRPDNLDNFFQRLRRAMPVDAPRLSAHRVRHTTSTILANNVPNLKVVQEQLGHASINTTYLYVHPDMQAMRKALATL
ncbi:conserved hypothetical protein [Rubrivivax sp. A210]|uniref:tyrosine-type recombinase/integrase n=1 Tax=Rubrivivax sp. A210 TaxID=2772301 RepID=UPI001918272C|nr:tyrosine-type recombinase/integrase [Rubrivivax sp. A210]CAD5366909.1 conserved hypothetical protein [Rubrivivax sp. A210]